MLSGSSFSRRKFLQTSLTTAAGLVLARSGLSAMTPASSEEGFSFILLGDLHYDKMEHHDLGWLEKNHPGDLSQIKNYTRITSDITPRLFSTVQEMIAQLNQSPATKVAFVIQAGDVVEGLCGTEELATKQDTEALAFIKGANLGAPFIFAKGNHDITGDGATAAYKNVFHPFLSEQTAGLKGGGNIQNAYYAVEHGNSLFCFFDAYDKASLDWLEATLAKRTAQHCFVMIHPPVVPYGARATWYLYSNDKEKAAREKILALLGKQNAMVLGGHIHKFNTIRRETPGGGKFGELAVSSIINDLDTKARTILDGVSAYNGDQITVEPKFSSDTADARRAIYAAEAPFVKEFEYADLPGYAVITVKGSSVQANVFSGVSKSLYKTVDLSGLAASA
jgi:UDP-2,3-diacylglucosamine pyrophosphatase LpxH